MHEDLLYTAHLVVGRTKMNQPTKLLDQVRNFMRLKHYSLSTEKDYVFEIKRFILYHNKRHPLDMNERHVQAFLTHLAVERKLSASAQNKALNGMVSNNGWIL